MRRRLTEYITFHPVTKFMAEFGSQSHEYILASCVVLLPAGAGTVCDEILMAEL
jgi:hypothetical protein